MVAEVSPFISDQGFRYLPFFADRTISVFAAPVRSEFRYCNGRCLLDHDPSLLDHNLRTGRLDTTENRAVSRTAATNTPTPAPSIRPGVPNPRENAKIAAPGTMNPQNAMP